MKGKEIIKTPVLDAYLTDFELREDDLLRKRVLDLGAGMRQFAFECAVAKIQNRGVWSLSDVRTDWMEKLRMLSQAKQRNIGSPVLKLWEEVGYRSMEANMRRLPFATNSFDLVLSRDAITHVFDNELPMAEAFIEVARVLALGGEARIFPGWLDNWTDEERRMVYWALAELESCEGITVEKKGIERLWAGIKKVPGVMIIIRKD